jgi:hypothetical protein
MSPVHILIQAFAKLHLIISQPTVTKRRENYTKIRFNISRFFAAQVDIWRVTYKSNVELGS